MVGVVSNLGRWAPWYERGTPVSYGDTVTYRLAAEWLSGLAVEDWGCGCARFRDLHDGPYLGVDGTPGWCDVVDDLATRRSSTPGLLLRHVLEHDRDWPVILANAVASATERIVVVTFAPDGTGEQVGWCEELGVPDIAIPHVAVDAALTGWHVDTWTGPTATAYGAETAWLARRPG